MQRKNSSWANLYRKINFSKTLGPNGRVTIIFLWKTGSRQGAAQWAAGGVFWCLLGRKGGPKGDFLKTMKIENSTPERVFMKVQHWGPLKTVPGSILKKHEKSMKKQLKFNGFWLSKTIEKCWKTNTFLDFRSFTKMRKNEGISKIMFFDQHVDMGFPGSTYLLIFDVLVWCQKMMICGSHPDEQKNNNKKQSKTHQETLFLSTREYLCWPGSLGRPRAWPERRERREEKKPFGEFEREGRNIGKF